MIAISYVETKSKTFAPGETVTGLSKADADWMKKMGYVKDDEPKTGKRQRETKDEL